MFSSYFSLSNYYGVDNGTDVVWQNEDWLKGKNLKLIFADAYNSEIFSLLPSKVDIIIDDGLHHISSNMNTLLATLEHVNIDGYIIIEDIDFVDIWYAVDFIMSQIPKFETKIIDCKNGKCPYIYLIKRKY